jgi:hypothetical protein
MHPLTGLRCYWFDIVFGGMASANRVPILSKLDLKTEKLHGSPIITVY